MILRLYKLIFPTLIGMTILSSPLSSTPTLLEVCDRMRNTFLAQKSAQYRALFPSDSIMGTCGPTCLINITNAVEVFAGISSGYDSLDKMNIIKPIVEKHAGNTADLGTNRMNIPLIARDFFQDLGLGIVSANAYQLKRNLHTGQLNSANDILAKLKKNEIAMLTVGMHWIIITGYKSDTKLVSFLDPNFPELSKRKAKFKFDLSSDYGFHKIASDIFHELYSNQYQHSESFSEETYANELIVLRFEGVTDVARQTRNLRKTPPAIVKKWCDLERESHSRLERELQKFVTKGNWGQLEASIPGYRNPILLSDIEDAIKTLRSYALPESIHLMLAKIEANIREATKPIQRRF